MPGGINPPNEWTADPTEDEPDRIVVSRRSCPFVGCRYHLFLERLHERPFPFRVLLGANETCALDVAGSGPRSHVRVARVLRLSCSTIEVIQETALSRANREVERRASVQGVSPRDILPTAELFPTGPSGTPPPSPDDGCGDDDQSDDDVDPSVPVVIDLDSIEHDNEEEDDSWQRR
ncbi:MAG TPA: hypothetical protein VJ891_01890 [Casimicrobiaceae bacterium]|nr:hypothetical protein [Casimicrobiaceae bacterium]